MNYEFSLNILLWSAMYVAKNYKNVELSDLSESEYP